MKMFVLSQVFIEMTDFWNFLEEKVTSAEAVSIFSSKSCAGGTQLSRENESGQLHTENLQKS